MRDRHLAALQTTLVAENWSGRLDVRSAIDGTVRNAGVARYRDLDNVHLRAIESGAHDDEVAVGREVVLAPLADRRRAIGGDGVDQPDRRRDVASRDREVDGAYAPEVEDALRAHVRRLVPSCDLVSVSDYDPYGNDKHENPQLAPMAIDNDPVSSWRTVSYKAADMSGKPGVGMLVDLGAPRPVDAVRLSLLGLGTDLTVYATDNPTKKMRTFTTMVAVTGAPSQVTLRVPRPVTTRYLVVWFTRLPSVDGRFQGGVSDIKVLDRKSTRLNSSHT